MNLDQKARLATMAKIDPLLKALLECESHLADWLAQSAHNVELFRQDPMTAIRAAKLRIDENLLCDLEKIATGIAVKLKAD